LTEQAVPTHQYYPKSLESAPNEDYKLLFLSNSLLTQPPLRRRRIRTVNRPIIIHPTRRIRNSIVPKTSIIIITQRVAARLTGNEALQVTHPIDPTRRRVPAQPAADRVQGQDAIVQAHADEFVGGVGRVVAVLGGRVGDAVCGLGRGVAGGAADDFGDEAAAEGGHAGEDEVAVGVGGELR
jgi:hypothetical protein